MSSSPALIIGNYISETSSQDFSFDEGNLFLGVMPDSAPDPAIVIRDSGGGNSELSYSYKRPSIQLYMRTSNYESGYSSLEKVSSFLNGKTNYQYTEGRIIQVSQIGDILYIGRNENEQDEFSVNFLLHLTQ